MTDVDVQAVLRGLKGFQSALKPVHITCTSVPKKFRMAPLCASARRRFVHAKIARNYGEASETESSIW